MPTRAEVLTLRRRELAALMRSGHDVEPAAVAGYEYRGTSLGMPPWIERLSWKTFKKIFHADPVSGAVRGWNLRIEQGPRAEEYRPMQRRGAPFSFGHFLVRPCVPGRDPLGCTVGLLLDYGAGGNARLDPTGLLRDPVVALEPGSADLLLGWTYVTLLGLRIGTPSFFLLERDVPVTHLAEPPRAAAPPRLSSRSG